MAHEGKGLGFHEAYREALTNANPEERTRLTVDAELTSAIKKQMAADPTLGYRKAMKGVLMADPGLQERYLAAHQR